MKPRIGITLGDQNGIGPEVVLKSLLNARARAACIPVIIGSIDIAEWYARRLGLKVLLKEVGNVDPRGERGVLQVIQPSPEVRPIIRPGRIEPEAGRIAGLSIEYAARLCLDGQLDGMVTGPVSKTALHAGGYKFPGQTEMLAHLSGKRLPLMILASGDFRVALVTIHVPLKRVPALVTKKKLRDVIRLFLDALRSDFGIHSPSIAVLGLNPHAGEDGHIGTEEREIVIPVVKGFARTGSRIEGPFAADGFFGTRAHRGYDGVVAMYHDQGLIPLKLQGFSTGVNITAGLPIVRTSPDHGTAFDIAGKGVADAESTIHAIELASSVVMHRRTRELP